MNSECGSDSELGDSRVTHGSEDSGDLSLRDARLGKPRSMNKRSFNPSNVDSRCKGDNGKGKTGRQKEGTQKGKESPLCCIDGHSPTSKSTSTSRGKCSQEQSQVWKLSSPDEGAVHELPEKIDEARRRVECLNRYNH